MVSTAKVLDGLLTEQDKVHLARMHELYGMASGVFETIDRTSFTDKIESGKRELIELYNEMGKELQEITSSEPNIKVYPFDSPFGYQGEASRIIAKLRDTRTQRNEFIYYIQRAYELLFKYAFNCSDTTKRNYLVTETPIKDPIQNYAVHKIPDVDDQIENSVICVMLRGALLPSLILGKEIQEYSSKMYSPPYALFRIQRDDSKEEHNMEYRLHLDRSYFDLSQLEGKDLVFADPMNATGGSLVTIIKYIMDNGIRPKSVKLFTVISALKGALRVVRGIPELTVYTLWMDPVLNDKAYILPGLGDAGDRLNGEDTFDTPRNIIQLIADYGSNIAQLYRAQVSKIEESVLAR